MENKNTSKKKVNDENYFKINNFKGKVKIHFGVDNDQLNMLCNMIFMKPNYLICAY